MPRCSSLSKLISEGASSTTPSTSNSAPAACIASRVSSASRPKPDAPITTTFLSSCIGGLLLPVFGELRHGRMSFLADAAALESRGYGIHENLEVKADGTVVNVLYVVFESAVPIHIIAAANLSETSDTWTNLVAASLLWRIVF